MENIANEERKTDPDYQGVALFLNHVSREYFLVSYITQESLEKNYGSRRKVCHHREVLYDNPNFMFPPWPIFWI